MQIQNDGAIPTQVLLFPENPGFRSETLILVEMKRHGGEVSLSKNDIGERP